MLKNCSKCSVNVSFPYFFQQIIVFQDKGNCVLLHDILPQHPRRKAGPCRAVPTLLQARSAPLTQHSAGLWSSNPAAWLTAFPVLSDLRGVPGGGEPRATPTHTVPRPGTTDSTPDRTQVFTTGSITPFSSLGGTSHVQSHLTGAVFLALWTPYDKRSSESFSCPGSSSSGSTLTFHSDRVRSPTTMKAPPMPH